MCEPEPEALDDDLAVLDCHLPVHVVLTASNLERICLKDGLIRVTFLASVSGNKKHVLSDMLVANRR